MEDEAYKTSEIEGELLNRDSIRSSLRRNFGLQADPMRPGPAEYGIAEMTTDLFRHYDRPLDDATLHQWHEMLMNGRRDVTIGRYRDDPDAMQVVSGAPGQWQVHFEAPPSDQVPDEMKQFIIWFNRTAPDGDTPLPALERAGLAHLHFVSIHPYDDGNGRLARAIAEKAIYQNIGQPTLLAMSHAIQATKKDYYRELETSQKGMNAAEWLDYFSTTARSAQDRTQQMVNFTLDKAKLYDQARQVGVNDRQKKALDRLFRAGLEGFEGGLSADNYKKITGAPPATATRDLHDMVAKGFLTKTGEYKATRYWLNVPSLKNGIGEEPAQAPRAIRGYVEAVDKAREEKSGLMLEIAEARLEVAKQMHQEGKLKVAGSRHEDIVKAADQLVKDRRRQERQQAPDLEREATAKVPGPRRDRGRGGPEMGM